MESGRLQNTVRSSTVGMIKTIVSIIGQFIVRSLLIWKLGNEYVGLDSLFASVLNVLNVTELGFGSAMCYSMYGPIAENDKTTLNALTNLNRRICRYIGLVILGLGTAMIPFLKFIVRKDAPQNVDIYLLYGIFLVNAVIGYFLYAYTISVVNAYQRNDIQSKASLIACLIKYVSQILVLTIFSNYWLYVVFIPIATIADNLIRYKLMKKSLPAIKCEGEVSALQKSEIRKQVYALFGHRLNGTIINSVDNIVISAFLGLIVLGKYNNYYYILNALLLFFSVFFEAIRPSIGNAYLVKNRDDNYRLFQNISFVMQWVTGWLAICLLCLYQPFIEIWSGKNGLLDFSTVILLSLLFYEGRNFDLLTVFKDAAGLWWNDRYRPYVASMANLIVNILLVKLIGLNGVIISTIATRVVISWPWISSVLFHEVFGTGNIKYLGTFVFNTILIGVIGLVTYRITLCVNFQTIFVSLFMKAIICSIIPNLIICIVYHRTNRFKECLSVCKNFIKAR